MADQEQFSGRVGRWKHLPPPEIRFWNKIKKGAPDECWPWTGTLCHYGYGKTSNVLGKNRRAHRIVWILTHGEIQNGLFVCHKCDNRKCCNPEHMFLGTQKDNIQDACRKGRFQNRATGERVHTAKLRASDVLEIRKQSEQGKSRAFLGRLYGLHPTSILAIVKRWNWKHV